MPTHRTARAIIFDLDGTLADTFPLIVRAWNVALTPVTGKTYSDEEVIARFGIPDGQMIVRELAGRPAGEAVDAYHACYEREHAAIVRPFEGIESLLGELQRRRVPIGVMTGKGRRTADITLRQLGWDHTFAAVITGDDVAGQKPAPDGPLAAAKKLGAAPADCAFVGDSPADIGAGRSAGMISVAAAWHPVFVEALRALAPDLWAERPADVLKVLG